MFESIDSEDCSHPDTLREESSSATTPTTEATKSNQTEQPTEIPATTSVETTDRQTSTGSKDTSSPDEGLGGSIAHTCSLSESRRSDSCDTDGNAEALKSESDDTATALGPSSLGESIVFGWLIEIACCPDTLLVIENNIIRHIDVTSISCIL